MVIAERLPLDTTSVLRAPCPCVGRCPCHEPERVAALVGLTALLIATWDGRARISPERLGLDERGYTPTEWRIVQVLLPPNRLRTHAEMQASVWPGVQSIDERHLLRVHVARLRPKLRIDGWTIPNAIGHGYRLERLNGGAP